MMDRLKLDDDSIEKLAKSVEEISQQVDPLGVSEGRKLPNGLRLQKVRVGIGVVGFIYESRPNVTVDAAALCIKAGNAVILKGGKEAVHSNIFLESVIRQALILAEMPVNLVQLLDCTDRGAVDHLVRLSGLVDLIIPRGGKGLIKAVVEKSLVPVIKHYEGNCHVYVHEKADVDMAVSVAVNAKIQRPGVCNAAESLIVDRAIAGEFLPKINSVLQKVPVEVRACPEALALMPGAVPATQDDWGREYLDLILSVIVVDDLDAAIAHIAQYSSGHTESIITSELSAARKFQDSVDSSVVMVNASTRFNDGGRFGLGAEIGISTDKLHARGPMGAAELTTYKYLLEGDGHILA